MLKRVGIVAAGIFWLLAGKVFAFELNALADSKSDRWEEIAKEAQNFIAPAGIVVRYGTLEKYVAMRVTSKSTVNCDNKTFGDPIPYTQKSCYVQKPLSEIQQIEPAIKIADEHEIFRAVPGEIIRYGARQGWKTRSVGANGVCDNNYFGGDPAPTTFKACYKDNDDKSYVKTLTPVSTMANLKNNDIASQVHLNVAGPGFSPETLPGKEGTNYVFPDATYLDKWQKGGIRVIRFSILWERLQPQQNQPFNVSYAKGVDAFLEQAAKRNMGVIIDIHNYGRYYGKVIGTPEMPTAAYEDLMKRVALRWGNNPGIHGYDLMNEPYGDADNYWKKNAQAGIDAIRLNDRVHPIYVEGRAWSNTSIFPDLNADLLSLEDPSNNLVYSSHLYLDEGSSGQYVNKIIGSFDPMIGVNRARPFIEWLIRNKKRGQIGEFGIPGDDPRWLTAMDNLLFYLHDICVPLAYWAAGPWWGNYPLSVEPSNGVMPPQWSILEKWIKMPSKKCI